MYIYQYLLMAGYTCLFFNARTKEASCAFLSGWLAYLFFVYGCGVSYYFVLSAFIEFCIAYKLNRNYRLVSYIGYSLIIVNLVGLVMNINGVKFVYDFTYTVLSLIQFLILIGRVLIDGNNRVDNERFIFRAINFDSRKTYVTMQKTNSAKKSSA